MRILIVAGLILFTARGLCADDQRRPFVGFVHGSENEVRKGGGAPVGEVLPDTPAEKAGLKAKDVIIAINKTPITNFATLHAELGRHETGDDIVITVSRGGKTVKLKIVLGDRPPAYPVRVRDGKPPRVPGGTITAKRGGTFTIQGGLNGGGNTIVNGSTLAVGTLFRQTWDGLLDFEITGRPNTSFVKVDGDIELAGNLYVHMAKTYKPKVGDTFEVISGGWSLKGKFGRHLLPKLPKGLAWKVHYDDVSKKRDFDGDGKHDVTLQVIAERKK